MSHIRTEHSDNKINENAESSSGLNKKSNASSMIPGHVIGTKEDTLVDNMLESQSKCKRYSLASIDSDDTDTASESPIDEIKEQPIDDERGGNVYVSKIDVTEIFRSKVENWKKIMFVNYYRIIGSKGKYLTAECKNCKLIVKDSERCQNTRNHMKVCIM